MENKNIRITNTEILSKQHYTLKKLSFDYTTSEGQAVHQQREVFDRGNGAGVLLYNKARQTVLLVNQFRMPTYLNGNTTGMLIEVCAGLLDEDNPDDCIIREIEEETGYKVPSVKRVFETYMSPGAVTELLYLYIAEYTDDMKVSVGGGKAEEQEHIETLELPFNKVMDMVADGSIQDAKTIMLLQYAALQGVLSN